MNVFILGKNVWLYQSGLDSAESWSNRTRRLALRPNNPLFLDVQPRSRSKLYKVGTEQTAKLDDDVKDDDGVEDEDEPEDGHFFST